jgi:hypothetical protein
MPVRRLRGRDWERLLRAPRERTNLDRFRDHLRARFALRELGDVDAPVRRSDVVNAREASASSKKHRQQAHTTRAQDPA